MRTAKNAIFFHVPLRMPRGSWSKLKVTNVSFNFLNILMLFYLFCWYHQLTNAADFQPLFCFFNIKFSCRKKQTCKKKALGQTSRNRYIISVFLILLKNYVKNVN